MDRLLTGENRELLMPFMGLMALMGLAQVVTSWIQAVYALKINGKMAIVGSSEYMWKVLRMPMEFFSQRMAGDILQRQGTNATIAATMVNTLTPLLLNTIMMVFYLVVMLRDDDGVAYVPQLAEDVYEPVCVARVESDAGFVEHVERANQTAAQRLGKVDALAFPA